MRGFSPMARQSRQGPQRVSMLFTWGPVTATLDLCGLWCLSVESAVVTASLYSQRAQ